MRMEKELWFFCQKGMSSAENCIRRLLQGSKFQVEFWDGASGGHTQGL